MFVLLFLVFLSNVTFWKIEHCKPIWGANENIMKSDSHFWIHLFVWISQTVTERLQASQFEHKGDIVTQNILNNFRWRMDFPRCRRQSTAQAEGDACALWCKISWRWHSGFWLSGAQTLHSFYFGSAPVLWALVRAPGTAWPFLQAVHRSFVLFGGGMRQSPFPSAGVQSCSLALLPARTVSLRCGCWGDFVEILLPALLTSVCPIREEILALNRPSARLKAELWMWNGDTKILGSTLCMLGIYPSLWRTGTKTWARPVSKVWFLQVTRMQGSLGLLWELSSLSDLFNKQASLCC